MNAEFFENNNQKIENMEHLKSHTGKFFEVSAKMCETQEDGTEKTVKHTVVVETETFGEAEMKALGEFTGSDVDVVAISVAPYTEVFTSENEGDDAFYKAKLDFVTVDEKTEREKHSRFIYLVQASSLNKALAYIDGVMAETMIDYQSVGVVGTSIEDVYLKQ